MITKFFERHVDKVNWIVLSKNTSINQEFFERYIDNVDWLKLSGTLRECIIGVLFQETHP